MLSLAEILEHKFTYDPAKSVFSIIHDLFDGKGNLVKFDYEGKALAPMGAAGRLKTGETLDPEAIGHIEHGDDPMAFIQIGSRKDNLNILLLRSMRTKKEDGSYDTRAYIVGSPINGLNIPEVQVNYPFKKGYENKNLRGLHIYPLVISDLDRAMLAEGLKFRRYLQIQKNACDEIRKALMAKFSRERKKNSDLKVIGPDGIIYYKPPCGETLALVDENNERVSKVPFSVCNGLGLEAQVEFEIEKMFEKPEKLELEKLPFFSRESKRFAKELKELNDHIRPVELGFAEISLNQIGKTITVFDTPLLVNQFDVKEYDYPNEMTQMIADGKWKFLSVPKSKGRTIFVEDGESEEKAEKEEEVEV